MTHPLLLATLTALIGLNLGAVIGYRAGYLDGRVGLPKGSWFLGL